MKRATVTVLLLLSLSYTVQESSCSKIFGGYFPNWAQYREKPYTFTPTYLQDIAHRLDHLVYSQIHFNSNNYSIEITEENDIYFLKKLASYKNSYPNFKLLISVGGDEFPSSNFSAMVKSNRTRTLFIDSLQNFLSNNSLDGVQINWKWPCSPPSILHKKHSISCNGTEEIIDEGSKCPQDVFHFLSLLKEMRHTLQENIIITISGSPLPKVIKKTPLKLFSKYIDYWYVETFGYALSATNHSYFTAPYSPLYQNSSNAYRKSHSIENTGDHNYEVFIISA